MSYAEPIVRLIREFAKLPGIGEKTAERLTFWLINQPKDEALKLAYAIRDLKETIRLCSECCTVTLAETCEICSSETRDHGLVCVVEETKDLWAIEKTGSFAGVYHVLHGRIAPIDGIGPNDLTIGKLVSRVRKGAIREIILATNPTVEGDATAYYILSLIRGVKVTRIARGLPAGSTMEYAHPLTIADALKGRKELDGATAETRR